MIVRVVEPLMAPEAAAMVVVPRATAVASPAALIVATAVFDEDQVAVLVRSCVVLSLNEPVAVNCRAEPVWIDGAAGVTEIETRLAGAFGPPVLELEAVFPPQPTRANDRRTMNQLRHREITAIRILVALSIPRES